MSEDYTTSPVFWLIFVSIILVVAAILLFLLSRIIGVSNWREVNATILSSSVTPIVGPGKGEQKHSEIGSGYRLDVRYEYVVDGKRYESARVLRGLPAATYPTEPRANRALEEYTKGSSVIAYVDPDNLASAVLISTRKFSTGAWVALYLLCSIVLAAFGALALSHFGVIDPRSYFENMLGGQDATHLTPEE